MLQIIKHNAEAGTDTLSDGSTVDHDCYDDELMDYRVENYTTYHPTPQEIDAGTDHDVENSIAVCNTCGADMPNIDVTPDEPDYDDRGDR